MSEPRKRKLVKEDGNKSRIGYHHLQSLMLVEIHLHKLQQIE